MLDEPDPEELPEDDGQPAWKKDRSFAAFWSSYPGPRRRGAPAAHALWVKLKLGPSRLPDVMRALNEDKASRDWIKENGRYIPAPAVWMKLQRWEDDPVPAEPAEAESNLLPFSNSKPAAKPAKGVSDETIMGFLASAGTPLWVEEA